MPLIRLPRPSRTTVMWAVAGLIAGGIVHILAVLATPKLYGGETVTRISSATPLNQMIALPPIDPDTMVFPFMSPDIRYALCRYDLSGGPLSLRTTLLDTTWTIALYDSQGRNFYAVSGRDLQRRDVEIVLAPSEDGGSAGVPLSRDTPASSITVSVRDPRGIAVVEAPLNGSSYASEAASALALSTCAIRERQRL